MFDWLKKIFTRAENGAAEELGEAEEVLHHPLYPIREYCTGVDPLQLTRGSWPDASLLGLLVPLGIRSVVNLCAERSQDAAVRAARLVPFNIPLRDNTAPSALQVAMFLGIIRDQGPVYVHCEAGKGRTGCMVAAYRVRVQGWTPAAALAEARKYGLGVPAQAEFILGLGRQR